MTNANIAVGSKVTACGGLMAEVISIKGRWVKVRLPGNIEKNVGFKDVTLIVEKAKPARRVSHKTPGEVCPKCGSHEVFHGRVVKGVVVDEDKVWGCHACGWDNLPKNGVVNPAARARYAVTRLGDLTIVDCGDQIAAALRGREVFEIYDIAADVLKVSTKELEAKYGHLNNGQVSMSLRNRIRKAVRTDASLMKFVK